MDRQNEGRHPAGIYMLKVNNRNIQGVKQGVVLVSLLLPFEHISHLVLVFLLLTFNM